MGTILKYTDEVSFSNTKLNYRLKFVSTVYRGIQQLRKPILKSSENDWYDSNRKSCIELSPVRITESIK